MLTKELISEKSELKITLEYNSEKWTQAINKAKEQLMKEVKLPGFRKGKVPKNKAEKLISPSKYLQLALEKSEKEIIDEMRNSIEEKDDVVGNSQSFEIIEVDDTKLKITGIFPTFPKFELPNYKKLDAKYELIEISEKDVNEAIDKLLKDRGSLKEVDGPIQEGDLVTFDFEGKLNGEEFDGGTATDFDLLIGSKQFIPGFEEGMIGLKKDETKDLNVTFPEKYHSPKLAGQNVVFKVKVNKIQSRDKLELNDEFVKDLKIENVNNVSELQVYYKDLLVRENEEKTLSSFKVNAFHEIMDKSNIIVSNVLVKDEIERIFRTFEKNIKQQGFTLKEFYKITGSNRETLDKQYEADAIHNLKESFIFIALSKAENLEATEDDYKEEYDKLAKFYKLPLKDLENIVSKAQLQIPIINKKVIKILAKYNSK
ncbi:trigger factor [[Mycoplasma] collis]|uniref:trigger factor n=1 Tax=[Mycoplasma] collis TaxID=2127 RepID=UPI00051AE3B8|nr:trigger factor [[Mycoplasma] collis]